MLVSGPGSPHAPTNNQGQSGRERRGRDIAIRTILTVLSISSFLFGLTHSSIVLLSLVVYYLPLHPLHHLFYSSIPCKTLIIITPLRHRTGHIYTSNTTLSSIIMPGYIVRPHHLQPLHLSQPTNPSSHRLPSSPKPPTTKSLRTSISSYNHKQHPIKTASDNPLSAKQDAVKQGGKIGHEYNAVFKGFS